MSEGAPKVRRAYAELDGRQVHYRICAGPERGKPALLLLHPTPKSGWIYEAILPVLAAQGRCVIAPDTPGYGASDPLPGEAEITDFAEVNFALLDVLRGEGVIKEGPLDVGGYHTGSSTSVQMALNRPEAVRKLVLFSLGAYDALTRGAKLAAMPVGIDPAPDGSHMTRMWDIVGGLCDARAGRMWQHRSVAENLRAHDTTAGYRAVYRQDLQAALDALDHPALLVNAEDDLFEVTRANRHRLARGTYVELPGTAHGMFDFAAGEIAALMGNFLD